MSWIKDTFYKLCPYCKAKNQVVYRDVMGDHEDTHHWCQACGKTWYCEGSDY